MQHVSFVRMGEGTAEDYTFLNALENEFAVALPARPLIRQLSIRTASRSPAKAIHVVSIYYQGQNPCQKPC